MWHPNTQEEKWERIAQRCLADAEHAANSPDDLAMGLHWIELVVRSRREIAEQLADANLNRSRE